MDNPGRVDFCIIFQCVLSPTHRGTFLHGETSLNATARWHYRQCCGRILTNFFSFSKLLVVVLGPDSVEELVSIEDTHTARFAPYGI